MARSTTKAPAKPKPAEKPDPTPDPVTTAASLEDTRFEAAKAAAAANGYKVVRRDRQVHLYLNGLLNANVHITDFIAQHELNEKYVAKMTGR